MTNTCLPSGVTCAAGGRSRVNNMFAFRKKRERLTERQCYRALYGDLIQYVDRYNLQKIYVDVYKKAMQAHKENLYRSPATLFDKIRRKGMIVTTNGTDPVQKWDGSK